MVELLFATAHPVKLPTHFVRLVARLLVGIAILLQARDTVRDLGAA